MQATRTIGGTLWRAWVRKSVPVLVFALAVACGAFAMHSVRAQHDVPQPEYVAGLGRGIAARVPLGDPTVPVAEQVDRMNAFFQDRAGVSIAAIDREALVRLETGAVQSGRNRITSAKLTEAIVASLLEDTVASLSQSEIVSAVERSRGTHALAAHTSPVRRAKARIWIGNRSASLDPDDALDTLSAMRQDPALRSRYALALRENVEPVVARTTAGLAQVLPGRFNQSSLTPVECVIVYYRVVTSDMLTGSPEEMARSIEAARKVIETSDGASLDSAVEAKPFGPDGLIFSSPADIVFARFGSTLRRLEGR